MYAYIARVLVAIPQLWWCAWSFLSPSNGQLSSASYGLGPAWVHSSLALRMRAGTWATDETLDKVNMFLSVLRLSTIFAVLPSHLLLIVILKLKSREMFFPSSVIVLFKKQDDTPFSGGCFNLEIEFPAEYPFKAPKVKFVTRIYHPNVKTDSGEICSDILNENWGPTLNVTYVLNTIRQVSFFPRKGCMWNGWMVDGAQESRFCWGWETCQRIYRTELSSKKFEFSSRMDRS